MYRQPEIGDKIEVTEWGKGVVIGSCPSQTTDTNPNGKVWIVKLESGKVVTASEKDLKSLAR